MDQKLVTHLLDQWPVQGVDLSYWNDRKETPGFLLDPKMLIRAGYRFAGVRRSQGLWLDPKFDAFWKLLKETKIETPGRIWKIDRFGYHFVDYFNYDRDVKGADVRFGIAQGKFFANAMKQDPGEIPPYIDLETNAAWFPVNFSNYRPVMNIAYSCINEISMVMGFLAGCYSNQGMYPYFGNALKEYDQWPSWYNDKLFTKKNIDGLMKKFGFKKGWKFGQHASDGDTDNNGTADGESIGLDTDFVDLNVFNGTEEEYEIYKGTTPAVVHPEAEDEVEVPVPAGDGALKTIRVKTVVTPLNLRPEPKAGPGNKVLTIMPVGTRVECLEQITRTDEIWWRVGQCQYCAERYNGSVFLK